MAESITELAKRLDPFIKRVSTVVTQQVIVNDVGFLRANGSVTLTGNLSVAAGVTIDGVDISALYSSYASHASSPAVTAHGSVGAHNHQTSANGGLLDHGAALSGLGDDDHPQYLDTFRHDTTTRHTLGTVVPVVTLSVGTGLSGGGALSINRTISVDPGDGITLAGGDLGVLAGNGIIVNGSGVQTDESYAHVWTGTHTFQADTIAHSITPEATDTYDLGTSSKLWRKGWVSELDTILFAQNTQVLLGGWFVVSKGEGTLIADLAAADTTCDFGQVMTVGDFIELRSSLAVEYIQVGSLVSGTTYNVTRNLDGSGANDWPAGMAYRINGQSGNGRIELNAFTSPRISILSQGAAYNAQTEQGRFGDLNGNWGYSTETYGIALGQYASGVGNLTYDPTNGLRLRTYSTTVMQFNSDNADIIGRLRMPGTSSAIAIGNPPPTSASDGTGLWIDRTGLYSLAGGTTQVKINAVTGELYAGNNLIKLDVNGINIVAGEGLGSAVTWYTAYEGPSVSRINSVAAGSKYDQAWLSLRSSGYMNDDQTGVIYLAAILGDNVDAAPRTTLKLSYSGGAEIDTTSGGTPRLRVASYVDIGDGLYVGNYSGGNPGTGNIRFTGALQSYKNSAAYTGYIYVPLSSPSDIVSGSAINAGTYNYTATSYGVPSGAVAVKVLIGGRWSSVSNSYYMQARTYGTSDFYAAVFANTANVNNFCGGDVPLDGSNRFSIIVGGANMSIGYIKIVGYYI